MIRGQNKKKNEKSEVSEKYFYVQQMVTVSKKDVGKFKTAPWRQRSEA